MDTLLDRFLRYVRIDTQAVEQTATYPSSPGQLQLGRLLVGELRELGLRDAEQDGHGIIMATVPATAKRAAPTKLKRLRNIAENPNVALVIDHYEEDWRKLAYALIFGKARVLGSGKIHRYAVKLLRRKYPQYRSMAIDERPMIVIRPKKISDWAFSDQSKIQKRPRGRISKMF